jgi:hypothetical protein
VRSVNDIVGDWGDGPTIRLDSSDYETLPGVNPSSLAMGLVGCTEVDVSAVKQSYESGYDAKSTDAMDAGTMVHLAILQPELLSDRVAVWCGGRRAGREWDEFESANSGRLMLRKDDYDSVMRSVEAFRSHPMVTNSIHGGSPEVVVLSEETHAGVTIRARGRVDLIRLEDRVIIDLKTTKSPLSHVQCERSIRDFRYREKMALYRRWAAKATGSDPDSWRCYNLFLSIGERPSIRNVKLSTSALEFGEARMMDAIESVCVAIDANEWPVHAVEDIVSVAPWEIEPNEGGVNYDE